MRLKSILKPEPLPDRNPFYMSLEKKLFNHSSPQSNGHWKLWTSLSSLSVLAVLGFVFVSMNAPTGIVLADAIANTLQFTPSENLLEQTISITKTEGIGTAPRDFIIYNEKGEEISPYPKDFQDISTWWLYQGNARVDSTWISDSKPQKFSSLVSEYDDIECTSDSTQTPSVTCSEPAQSIPFLPFKNDGRFEISNLKVEPYEGNKGGDILITWESYSAMENPVLQMSTGPSGYRTSGYPVESVDMGNGKFKNSVYNINREDLRFNASNAFYPDESGKVYVQIADLLNNTDPDYLLSHEDNLQQSDVYLLDIDDYTLVPVSDEELEQSQAKYRELTHLFELSTERMEQDYETRLESVRYLQKNLSSLEALGEARTEHTVILSYGVPATLKLYGGTNYAIITKASFTIDQDTKRITSYSLYDANGTDVEHAEITQKSPSLDPESLFTKEAWLKSL